MSDASSLFTDLDEVAGDPSRVVPGRNVMGTLGAFCHDEDGATAVEYGLLAGLFTLIVIAAVTTVGTNLTSVFNRLATLFAPTT